MRWNKKSGFPVISRHAKTPKPSQYWAWVRKIRHGRGLGSSVGWVWSEIFMVEMGWVGLGSVTRMHIFFAIIIISNGHSIVHLWLFSSSVPCMQWYWFRPLYQTMLMMMMIMATLVIAYFCIFGYFRLCFATTNALCWCLLLGWVGSGQECLHQLWVGLGL